jgi:hypothetical protein
MTRWICAIAWWGAALSLGAQTLALGTAPAGAGQTFTTVLNVTLATAGKQIAALQFDLAYDTSALTIVTTPGSSTTTAGKSVTAIAGPACSSGCTPLAAGAQRAIVAGGPLIGSVNSVFTDGVVATLTVTVNAGAALGNRVLTLQNVTASDPNANAISITPVNGAVNVAQTYLVGDVSPYTSNTAPNFGSGSLNILDLIQLLFAVNNIPGYKPAACSDRFDAMDTYPPDTATTRGGDGVLNIFDLITELFRVNNIDTSRPVRPSLGGLCVNSISQPQTNRTTPAEVSANRGTARPPAEIRGTLVVGSPQTAAAAEQVPVYLLAGRDLDRVALTFGLGNQQSQLHFVNGAGTPPSLMQDGQPGAVALAWLEGLTVRAGERLLLGYVTGPPGFSANLKVFGLSASGLNNNQEVGLDVSGATAPPR